MTTYNNMNELEDGKGASMLFACDNGRLSWCWVNNGYGVRPVITLNIDELEQNMNKVILIGRLVRDPELGVTPSNVSFVKFDLAVDRPYNSEKQTREVDFISCVVWRKQAENLHKYCHKGSQVAIEGHLTNRSFTAQDGTKKYNTEVVCEKISYLNSSNKGKGNGNTANENTDAFEDFGEEITLSDDDLPFEQVKQFD